MPRHLFADAFGTLRLVFGGCGSAFLAAGHPRSAGVGLIIEVVRTFGFLVVIRGSTDTRTPLGCAPVAIGWR